MTEIKGQIRFENDNSFILDLERSLLNGQSIDEQLLFDLPLSSITNSPLLTKAYGELQIYKGQLLLGIQNLSTAVKGLAAQGLDRQMLETLACLANVHLRTGNLSEAQIILLFLKEEFSRQPSSVPGSVAHTLAKGAFLLNDQERLRDYIRTAFVQYAEQSQFSLYGSLLLDLWTGLVEESELGLWDIDFRWVEQKVRLNLIAESVLTYISGMNYYYEQGWEEAISCFDRISPSEMDYFYSTMARIFRIRSQMRIGSKNNKAFEKEVHVLQQMLEQYEADVELRFFDAIVRIEWYRLKPDPSSASEAQRRAVAIHQLVPFPNQARELALINESSHSQSIASKTSLHIYCFGRLRFVCNGQQIHRMDWKRKKTQELFVFLLLQPYYEASRDRILELLFDDTDDPVRTTNRLYVTIHDLRRMIRDHLGIQDAVVVKEGKIRIQESAIEYLDVEQFTSLARVGEQLWEYDRELAVEMFERATQLYGHLIPEINYVDWLEHYREVFIGKQVLMLKRLAHQNIREHRFDQAEWYLNEWLRISPLQEEAHYEMILLLITKGSKTEAYNWYYKWEQICREELGILPTPETRNLVMGITK